MMQIIDSCADEILDELRDIVQRLLIVCSEDAACQTCQCSVTSISFLRTMVYAET